MNLKELMKKTIKFLKWTWNSESWQSYLVFLILVFIIIKFIFFPFMSLVTGTALPLAIVESCSMYHEGNFFTNYDNWWDHSESKYQDFDITKEQFQEFSFKKGFDKGDILFVIKANPDKLKVGDIIIFQTTRATPIIHRIVSIQENQETGEKTFSTIGDHNNAQLAVEKTIKEDQLIGKAQLRLVPYIGWIKLIFFEHSQPQINKGFCDRNY